MPEKRQKTPPTEFATKPLVIKRYKQAFRATAVAARIFANMSGELVEWSSIPTTPSLKEVLVANLNIIFPRLQLITDYQRTITGFDALVFDTERQLFAVIECMEKDGGLEDRVREYGDVMKNTHFQNSILAAYRQVQGSDDSLIKWPGVYVILLSEHFSDRKNGSDVRSQLPLPTLFCKLSFYNMGLKMEMLDYVEPNGSIPDYGKQRRTILSQYMSENKPRSPIQIDKSQDYLTRGKSTTPLSVKPKRKHRLQKESVASFFTKTKYGMKINKLAIHMENKLVKLGLKVNIDNRKNFVSYKYGEHEICTLIAAKNGLQIFCNFKESVNEPFIHANKQNMHLGAYASDIDNYEKIDVIIPVVERMLKFEKDAKPSGTGIRPPAKTEPGRVEPDKPPQGHVSTSDPSLAIPFYEEPATEFKASFNHDYLAEKHQKDGNAKAVQKQKERVKKSCHGMGLKFEVARAIAGLLNSYHERGRVWVGVKDGKGNRPSAVLGLGKDNLPKNPDEIGRHVSNMLRKCFKKYHLIEPNLLISFPKFRDKTVCLIKVKKSMTDPVFLSTGDYVVRQQNAAQTDTLDSDDVMSHIKTRYPDK